MYLILITIKLAEQCHYQGTSCDLEYLGISLNMENPENHQRTILGQETIL